MGKRFLVVTEKHIPPPHEFDGGARLINSLRKVLGDSMDVIQFDIDYLRNDGKTKMRFQYPYKESNRFLRRISNAPFIAEKVLEVSNQYSDILFVHVSMQFGFIETNLSGINTFTFPMFLGSSYQLSGEVVPDLYFELERKVLKITNKIISPSYFEKAQLINDYNVEAYKIKVIPRGIDTIDLDEKLCRITPSDKINFSSIGSIKPQKNTIGLIKLFSKILLHYPNSTLQVIGAVQDKIYERRLRQEINDLGISSSVRFLGHVSPSLLKEALKETHFHITASNCETFARSSFETLSLGIPNICNAKNNAAKQFLEGNSAIQFYDSENEIIGFIANSILTYETQTISSINLGKLYNDNHLSELLRAELIENPIMCVADFDGTLFHKNEKSRTKDCIENFVKYPVRVVCTSRSLDSILNELADLNIDVDYIIAWSGAVITDKIGNILWINGFNPGDGDLLGFHT
ncbi:MAG TPA: glycosyltransferase, partial [Bacteroidia bacterium]|nr:glycosyltransferase [Bacteroidia bacterium]